MEDHYVQTESSELSGEDGFLPTTAEPPRKHEDQ